ncbi:biotin transporter BioY [Streptococcus pseudoporcinus]|uniref:Biotin transporter n=1 Tax=Streptococcus pseudoporcinus LQ 940-04 TaxID=875093 RepID=G5K793_9STRE|nr:biotin transporter BioY [Streptococcus pseudoporcinus]EFR44988.1 BioY family protein [Streptococcus pseudoporcinus SPIN 20026]EHI64641.1 BioY family protein [Streptococcus pseudoporcinus LQ 940-04]VEF93973.1 BioY family protein [Streptococcus pseudoporcinus]
MFTTKDLAYMAMMTTLIIILGFIPPIPLGFIPVPIVLQNMGIMLAALLLGGKKGSVSVLLFLLIGFFVPVFSGKATTLPVFMGPTAGYVFAWLLVPFLFALLFKLLKKQSKIIIFVLIWLVGVLLVDVFGAVWLSIHTGMPIRAALVSNLAFIPGDTIKAALATLIALKLRESYINIR